MTKSHGNHVESRFRCNIVEIQITQGCNNRCRYCSAAALGNYAEPEMPWPLFQLVCKRLNQEVDGGRLILTGGEPTVHSRFADVLAYARITLPNWILHVQTNARGLNRWAARMLAGSGVDSLNISIQSVDPQIHDQLVGVVGAHGEAIAGLKQVLAASP